MLIWGWRRTVAQLAIITLVCGHCHNPSAHNLRKLTTWFTLFFIPLIPLSSKHTLQCTFCGAGSEVAKDRVPELLATAQGVPQAPAQGMPQQQPAQSASQPWATAQPQQAAYQPPYPQQGYQQQGYQQPYPQQQQYPQHQQQYPPQQPYPYGQR
ncbi:zinc-ribbon domain-containing protein [Nocardia sp. alder85J]|uniref:zinc-ribbon domain-containing protein n=1 Tax=Nocardia sp. alder85J TaxID=2862949 RepID=UPI001CD613B0|nr:zinc-ribbon domain-containing protein [Nocardia sp. alder85J]MCX4097541.1 zinc-ribbon domain-containing protein [Nocardia sp. alder85J]